MLLVRAIENMEQRFFSDSQCFVRQALTACGDFTEQMAQRLRVADEDRVARNIAINLICIVRLIATEEFDVSLTVKNGQRGLKLLVVLHSVPDSIQERVDLIEFLRNISARKADQFGQVKGQLNRTIFLPEHNALSILKMLSINLHSVRDEVIKHEDLVQQMVDCVGYRDALTISDLDLSSRDGDDNFAFGINVFKQLNNAADGDVFGSDFLLAHDAILSVRDVDDKFF